MDQTSRPRLAIIGGGGAMGRLFARLFVGRVREMVLFDYFGSGPRQSNLALTLEEIRVGAKARGLTVDVAGLELSDAGRWRETPDRIGDRALVTLCPEAAATDREGEAKSSTTSLSDLLDRKHARTESDLKVLLVQPDDTAHVLDRADVVLIALRFESAEAFARVIRTYCPWIGPGSLVVDLGSVKALPMEVLSRELDRGIGLLGAHPLFGPAVSDLTGLIVASVDPADGRAPSPWRGWFLEQLADLRVIVTPATATEHDDAMAFVQSLTHFALLSFAYTFVRLDRDPADLLALRTPVFEPLLYLAARVANLARSNPDTYRSIQAFSARPDARRAFVESAEAILEAIEATPAQPSRDRHEAPPDPLSELFRRYGAPWSPDGKDRRERQRREHFLDMGAGLVDDLNHLRQEIVSAVGEVRGIEERRSGQPRRVVVGVVDLDLLDPGKRDVATRIRLRRLNLALGSVRGGVAEISDGSSEDGQDEFIPLARARVLGDRELCEWLYQTGQLVESRTSSLLLPVWFDRDVVRRLVTGPSGSEDDTPIWDVTVEVADGGSVAPSLVAALVTFSVVVHPRLVVRIRENAQKDGAEAFRRALTAVDVALGSARQTSDAATDPLTRESAERQKDGLKHQRKALIDRRTREIDRDVRRSVRLLVQQKCDATVSWLLNHGCERPRWPEQTVVTGGASDGSTILPRAQE